MREQRHQLALSNDQSQGFGVSWLLVRTRHTGKLSEHLRSDGNTKTQPHSTFRLWSAEHWTLIRGPETLRTPQFLLKHVEAINILARLAHSMCSASSSPTALAHEGTLVPQLHRSTLYPPTCSGQRNCPWNCCTRTSSESAIPTLSRLATCSAPLTLSRRLLLRHYRDI